MEERISKIGARLIEIIPTEQKREDNVFKKISLYGGAVNNGEDDASKESACIWHITIASSQFCCKFKTAFLKKFCLNRVYLKCCVNFRCTAILIHVPISTFLRIISSYKSLQSTESNSLCYYSKCLLVFYFI